MTHLAQMLNAYQQKHDVEGKKLAREIGIHESSLTRIKQGKLPNAISLAKIVSWQVRAANPRETGKGGGK